MDWRPFEGQALNVDDAIELVKEKDRRSVRCKCLDCEAQTLLVAEVESLRLSVSRWAREFTEQAALTERAVQLAEKLRKHLRHAAEVCPCPDCWRKRHGGAPGPLTGKHMVVYVEDESARIWAAEEAELQKALQDAGLSNHTAVEAIKILDAEETRLSAELRERDRPEER